MEIDSIIIGLTLLAFAVPTGVILWTYYQGRTKDMPLLRHKRVFKGTEGAKVIFMGDESLQFDGIQFDSTFYDATVLEQEETPEYMTLVCKDDINGGSFILSPISKKTNLQLLSISGAMENRNVFACNIDRKNRVFPWNSLLLKKYKLYGQEMIEDRIEARVTQRFEKMQEQKNLLFGQDITSSIKPTIKEINIGERIQ